MKKILLFVILAFSMNVFAQWTSQNSFPQGKALSSIYFTDDNKGYAVGDSGTIIKTIDAGVNWTKLASGTTNNLNSVYFVDANTGYAVGGLGTILKTIDAGTNWTALLSGISNSLLSVRFTDANTGYAVGVNNSILKTIDGGKAWTDLSIGPNGDIFSVYFTDANTGYAACSYTRNGGIIKTVDGGKTWTFQSSSLNHGPLYSVYFTDSNTGYAVGGNFFSDKFSLILKTTNGGLDWITQNSTNINRLWSVYFTDTNTGYAVGDSGTILKTMNGGTDWIIQDSQTSSNLTSVYFADANTGYVVSGDFASAGNDTILKTINGGGLTTEVKNQSQNLVYYKIYPNPSSDKITIETSAKLTQSELSILNINGQELMTRQITEPLTQINISNLPNGIYFVRVTGDQKVHVEKFLKQYIN